MPTKVTGKIYKRMVFEDQSDFLTTNKNKIDP
jgi:hypothetical protein